MERVLAQHGYYQRLTFDVSLKPIQGRESVRISRRFTVEGQDPFAAIKFAPRTSRIVNPDGTVVFEMKDIHVPDDWSQVAVDILAQKYFRKAGNPPYL
jgi:ribonucleoside-diphosphate reductase alpha chain